MYACIGVVCRYIGAWRIGPIESGYAADGRYAAGGGAASFSLLQRVGVNTARCGALGVATVGN